MLNKNGGFATGYIPSIPLIFWQHTETQEIMLSTMIHRTTSIGATICDET